MNNPINMIKNMMNGLNPKGIAMNMLKNNSNPVVSNLIQMAESGNTKEIEKFAKNYFKERNRDFDKEFSDFMNNFK